MVFLSGLMAVLVLVVGIVIRIAAAQHRMNDVFSVPSGTKVVCIGNSHTGCTWYESAEFSNRVLWTSATGFSSHYMRFREFERRGVFDGGVKYCIVDCDGPCFNGFSDKGIQKRFVKDLPFSWRYCSNLPVSILRLAVYVLRHASDDFSLDEKPPEQVPDWTTRTKEEQMSNIIGQYGKTPSDWKTGFADDWQDSLLWMIGDMKRRCELHGVKLICFAAPLTTASPSRNNIMLWERETRLIERVKALGIEYYDFRTSCADNLFRDSHHLLKNTSYDFTKRFFKEVLKL